MIAVVASLAFAAGCGALADAPGATPAPEPGTLQVTGVVIDVDGPDAATVERFSINTDQGLVLEFIIETLDITNGGLPATHLRDHLVSGEPVTVTYRINEEAQNVALRYADAA